MGEDAVRVAGNDQTGEGRSAELRGVGIVGDVVALVFVARWEGDRALHKACEKRAAEGEHGPWS